MSKMNDDALLNLVKGITSIIEKSISGAKFNKGLTGRIKTIINDSSYIVTINGNTYTAKSKINNLQIDQVVKIIAWNNDMNELYIIY